MDTLDSQPAQAPRHVARPPMKDFISAQGKPMLEVLLRLQQAECALRDLGAGDLADVVDPDSGESVLFSDTQKALFASHSRYARILARLGALVFEVTPDGVPIFVHDTVIDLLGVSAEEARRGNWWDLLFPAPFGEEGRRLRRALETGDVEDYEIGTRTADGRPVIWRLNSANEYGPNRELQRVVCVCRDVTRLRQEEIRSESLAERYRRILESTGDGIYEVDAEGRCRIVNNAGAAMLGYDAGELIGADIHALIHDGRRDGSPCGAECPLAAVVRAHRGYRADADIFRRKDGEAVWVTCSAFPVVEDGAPAGAIVAFSNITALKNSEEKTLRLVRDLDRRIRQLSVLHETARVLQQTPAGDSPAFEEIVRLLPSAFPGFSPAAVRIVFDGKETATRNFGRSECTLRSAVSLADGRTCLAEVALNAGANADGVFTPDDQRFLDSVLKVLAEHLERRAAEQSLTRQNELLQNILDNIPVMIAYIGPDGEHRWVNRHWETTLGWTYAEIRGRDILESLYPGQEDQTRVREFMLHPPGDWAEFRTRTRDERLLDTSWAIVALSGGACIAIGVNLTERKRLEEQLLQAQKMESIGRLAGGVAHDFNNILSAILGNVEFALDALPDGSTAAGDIEQIRESGLRAKDLTKQLLAFARKQVIEAKVVAINDLILGLGQLLKRLIGEDILLDIQPNATEGVVRCDPGQFQQVLVNLAVNARDAMANGGRLTITSRDATLGPGDAPAYVGLAEGRYVVVEVRDTGLGIDAPLLETIFEPFFTTKEIGRGTGLGLSTCYGIVKQVGGYIWAENARGRGAVFRIALPAAHEAVPAQEGPPRPGALHGGDETVLIVEDEPAVRLMATRGLQRLGYRVLAAASGAEALETADREGFVHLLVTDAVMPGLGGAELIQRLRLTQPGVRVILMSGYTETDMAGVGRTGVRFLQKPFTPSDLGRLVRETLDAPAVR